MIHLRDAFIEPDKDIECTGEDESLFLDDSHSSSGSSMDTNEDTDSCEDMISDNELNDLRTMVFEQS